jgi:N-acetylglutamate synthase-like GNAT family acetyltransferase
MAISIRTARPADVNAMIALDTVAATQEHRRSEIQSWVTAGSAVIADDGSCVVGYAVLEYSFFGQGFIAMLCIAPSRRRQGVATSLLRHLERTCRTPKLFTSTNESNAPMQALMSSLGYQPSGVVYNLDENDPELFFFKPLQT